jgi:hypothetical protein
VPVGTSFSAGSANQLAQVSGRGSESAAATRGEPVARSIVGGETREGVSVEGGGNRGDLNSEEGPGTITVSNSTDLNALAQAVALANLGENITIEGSNFTTPGGVNIDAGTIFERTLTLKNTTIVADIIKARGFNNGGRDALLIEGGRYDAGRLIRLYAAGDSTLRFRGDVELNSPDTQLAGRTVQIDAGGRVRASGNVRVNADNHNYDAPGFGTLESGGTRSQGNFDSRRRY